MELLRDIEKYWTNRAEGYSQVNQEELAGENRYHWIRELEAQIPSGRKEELEILADYLVQKKDIRSNEKIAKHADWADTFCKKYDGITEENVMDILKKEVGDVFVHVLEDAGVYKCTEKGREAFLRFVKTL